jgi:hypothetical protein
MSLSNYEIVTNDKVQEFYAFKYIMNISSIRTLPELKKKLIEEKMFHPKYLKKFNCLDTVDQVKDFIYLGVLPEEEKFEGIATVVTSVVLNDKKKLMHYIFSLDMGAINILRVLVTTLQNIDIYKDSIMLYRHLKQFKQKYEPRMKQALSVIGTKPLIDKFDLTSMFFSIM